MKDGLFIKQTEQRSGFLLGVCFFQHSSEINCLMRRQKKINIWAGCWNEHALYIIIQWTGKVITFEIRDMTKNLKVM